MISLSLSEYQILASETNEYPNNEKLIALVLGLVGETGEVTDKYKKYKRGDLDHFEDTKEIEFRYQMRDELGDVLWYISQIAIELDLDLEYIAINNLSKLQGRKDRNKIKGNGDNR